MITSSDPTAALAFLRRLHDETSRIDGFPLLRAGICAGPVVKRRGDVFGSTVNTAARLAAVAKPGQIVGNAEAAAALRATDLLAMTSLGPLRLRNVGAWWKRSPSTSEPATRSTSIRYAECTSRQTPNR